MLARLFKGRQLGPELVPTTVGSNTRPPPPPLTTVPNYGPGQAPRTGAKRRAKGVRIARLYPERPTEVLLHSRALMELIRQECPDFVGRYIPKLDLERTYGELCAAEGWKPRHWTALARQLGRMTKKRQVKRAGARFIAYRIP